MDLFICSSIVSEDGDISVSIEKFRNGHKGGIIWESDWGDVDFIQNVGHFQSIVADVIDSFEPMPSVSKRHEALIIEGSDCVGSRICFEGQKRNLI